jgi:molecular chaperone GrpE (heat shock protein)
MTQDNEFYGLGLEIEDLGSAAALSHDSTESDKLSAENHLNQMNEKEPEEALADPESAISDEEPADNPVDEETDTLISIRRQLEDLTRHFESKLKYDDHKNKIIDDLHQALQEYRQGLVQKYLQRVFVDVIKIIDDMRKFHAHHAPKAPDEETTEKILKFIKNTASDLEDVFTWEGIAPFTCDGESLDPSRQRVVDKIATDDPAKDKAIAQRLRPGYAFEGRILRSELVNIYVFSDNPTPGDRER